jgi:hypothetical protein
LAAIAVLCEVVEDEDYKTLIIETGIRVAEFCVDNM